MGFKRLTKQETDARVTERKSGPTYNPKTLNRDMFFNQFMYH